MGSGHLRALALVTLVGTTACDPAPIVIDDGGPADVPVTSDAGADAPTGSAMWGPCVSELDCPAGGVCDPAFPGGVCTVRCTDSCAEGVCYGGRCARPCVAGEDDCASVNGSCFVQPGALAGFCIGACYPEDTRPSDVPECGPGFVCNPWTNACNPAGTPLPPAGAPEGDPCETYADCRGYVCQPETNLGSPTGWVNGMCLTYGRQPASDAYVEGEPLPRSNCAEGLAVPPMGWLRISGLEGDIAYCMVTCESDAECRPGYECDRGGEPASPIYANGVCVPIDDCDRGVHTCPSGYECRAVSGTVVCAPM